MPRKTVLNIVVADAVALVRHGLCRLIEALFDQAHVEQVADGRRALALLRATPPCLAVLDADLPGLDALAIARAVRRERLAATLIVLTTDRSPQAWRRARALGVKGYVLKDSSTEEIAAALRAVVAGDSFVSPALRETAQTARAVTPSAPLTPTEARVLQLLGEYKTNPQIAAELGVSYRTVQKHCHNIRQKLNLRGPKALLRYLAARDES